MSLLERARDSLREKLFKSGFSPEERVAIRPLHPDEAVGTTAPFDLALRRGPEKIVQAEIQDTIGQAFTDVPQEWSGTIAQALDLDTTYVPHRAHLVATLNALSRRFGLCAGTLHCRDREPETCGKHFADEIQERYGNPKIGMFGFQPYIVTALVKRFGVESVTVADLNPSNIGMERKGVVLKHGDQDAEAIVKGCTLGIVTGSSIVNGTLDRLLGLFEREKKLFILFGNTISGVAGILGLDRFCPFGK